LRDNALVWLSPFGWAQALDAFGDERWWPAALLLVGTGLLLALSAALTTRRDFGGGLLQPRAGRPRATTMLSSPLGLALRLLRGSILGWAIGLALLAVVYGAVVPTVPDLLESNPEIADYIGVGSAAEAAVIDAFLRYVLLFLAVVTTGFGVGAVLRQRAEEESNRAEQVLATRTSRTQWMGSIVAVAVAGSLVVATSTGIGLAVGYALAGGAPGTATAVVGNQLTYVPAVLVVVGFAAAVVGLVPRMAPFAWALAGVSGLQVMLGQTLRLPDWIQAMSPFWHLPGVPEAPLDVVPGAVELALAAVLAGIGLWGHRRRDLDLT
jgi:ABC-2 type transport system permease protein